MKPQSFIPDARIFLLLIDTEGCTASAKVASSYFNLHDTAPGALTLPPPRLNFNQHCCATNTPALHPEVEWHTAQHASFELAGRTSLLDGSLPTCQQRHRRCKACTTHIVGLWRVSTMSYAPIGGVLEFCAICDNGVEVRH